jgi:hypothetical protein
MRTSNLAFQAENVDRFCIDLRRTNRTGEYQIMGSLFILTVKITGLSNECNEMSETCSTHGRLLKFNVIFSLKWDHFGYQVIKEMTILKCISQLWMRTPHESIYVWVQAFVNWVAILRLAHLTKNVQTCCDTTSVIFYLYFLVGCSEAFITYIGVFCFLVV